MTMKQPFKLQTGDKIDHRDENGRFDVATIQRKKGTNLFLHYDGLSSKWDVWNDIHPDTHRFSKAKSISKRPAHRYKTLRKGDMIYFKPIYIFIVNGNGVEFRIHQHSGQIEVIYEHHGRNHFYWSHLDHTDEIKDVSYKTQNQRCLKIMCLLTMLMLYRYQ